MERRDYIAFVAAKNNAEILSCMSIFEAASNLTEEGAWRFSLFEAEAERRGLRLREKRHQRTGTED